MRTLVGKQAPTFRAKAVVAGAIQEQFSLESLKGRYVILFFYPLNFTFVCPTELHAFQERLSAFHERGAEIVGCSVDSPFSHLAWLATARNKGGIEGVSYPLIADLNKEIASQYGVLKEDEGIAYRGLFLIDKGGLVRHQTVNDLPLGRSVDEALRMLDALITFEQKGEVCPANWSKGKPTFKATAAGVANYLSVK